MSQPCSVLDSAICSCFLKCLSVEETGGRGEFDFALLHQADPGSQRSELAFRPHCKHVLSCFTVWVFNELSSPLNSKKFC